MFSQTVSWVKEFAGTLTGQEVSNLQEKLVQATQALLAQSEQHVKDNAERESMSQSEWWTEPAFLSDGVPNPILAGASDYTSAQVSLADALDNREATVNTALKALKIGTGVAVGATLTGLIWREVNRRQSVLRRPLRGKFGLLAMEEKKFAKRYGKLAAKAIDLWVGREIHSVMIFAGDGGPLLYTVQKVSLNVSPQQVGFMVDVGVDQIFIAFDKITRIEITEKTDGQGRTEKLACLVVKQ